MRILGLGLLLVSSVSFGADEMETLPAAPPYCDVRLWAAHDVSGGRCRFMDEVMVGIKSVSPLIIRCSRLEVRCNRTADDK